MSTPASVPGIQVGGISTETEPLRDALHRGDPRPELIDIATEPHHPCRKLEATESRFVGGYQRHDLAAHQSLEIDVCRDGAPGGTGLVGETDPQQL